MTATQDYTGTILSTWTVRHEAHWDSGQPDSYELKASVWDEEAGVVREVSLGWNVESPLFPKEGDASEEIRSSAKAYSEVRQWIGAVLRIIRERHKLSASFDKGDIVEVIKGRKVKKGQYRIVSQGVQKGSYGEYVNLAELDPRDTPKLSYGKVYSYVSVDNIKSTKTVKLDDIDYGEFFNKAAGTDGYGCPDVATMLVLADYMQEQDDPREPHLRNFANALLSGKISQYRW